MDTYFPFQPLLGGSIQESEPASLMSCSGVSLGDSAGGILLKVPADSTRGLVTLLDDSCSPRGAHGFAVRSGDRVPRCFRRPSSSSPRSGSVPPDMTFRSGFTIKTAIRRVCGCRRRTATVSVSRDSSPSLRWESCSATPRLLHVPRFLCRVSEDYIFDTHVILTR